MKEIAQSKRLVNFKKALFHSTMLAYQDLGFNRTEARMMAKSFVKETWQENWKAYNRRGTTTLTALSSEAESQGDIEGGTPEEAEEED